MTEFVLSIIWFTGLIFLLTTAILIVRSKLMTKGNVSIIINNNEKLYARIGDSLLSALAKSNIFLASACGGKGTCGQCKVIVDCSKGILPTEMALLRKREIRNHTRLACQLVIKNNLSLQLPPEILNVKKRRCRVISTRNVATFIKEIVLALPEEETIDFKAGAYIMLEAPAFEFDFKCFKIDSQFITDWDRYNLWRYTVSNKKPTLRAYSMANYPAENTIIILNVRIALPPPGAEITVPAGIVSSYLFSLQIGDTVNISGPYGDFLACNTQNEMVFIGGGAGMAPMRSHIFDQLLRLRTNRKITFWYGARNLQELFYKEEFDQLQDKYENFSWRIALSDPKPEDQWHGDTGLIHQVIEKQYLHDHPSPEDCEYYLCGPPMMNAAVTKMLEDLGVDKENIMLDDFQR